ncbi:MAG: MmcQ/YjbR family DNA-binding protein [Candidatus Eisenbacteria bacterium]
MTAGAFRKLALRLPEALESAHMGHPDFRVRGKIFATLGPKEAWGMVMLTPVQQERFVLAEPNVFEPLPGAWGRKGCTRVELKPAKAPGVRLSLLAAWHNKAPKKLAQGLDDEWPR